MPGILGRKLEEEEGRKRLAYEEHERRRMAVQPRVGGETLADAVQHGKAFVDAPKPAIGFTRPSEKIDRDAAVTALRGMAHPNPVPQDYQERVPRQSERGQRIQSLLDHLIEKSATPAVNTPEGRLWDRINMKRYGLPMHGKDIVRESALRRDTRGPDSFAMTLLPELGSAMPRQHFPVFTRHSPVDIYRSYIKQPHFESLADVDAATRKASRIYWADKDKPSWTEKLANTLIYDVASGIGDLIPNHYVSRAADTGSMEPGIVGGDIFVFKYSDGQDLDVGDIVSFHPNYGDNTRRIAHRITGTTPHGYITRGDAADFPDPGTRAYEDIRAEQVFHIPLGQIPFFRDIAAKRLERQRQAKRWQ